MAKSTPRSDLLVYPEGGGFALPGGAVRGVLRWMAAAGLAVPVEEQIAREWTTLYLQPGVSAHDLFEAGAAPAEAAFLEAVLHFRDKAAPAPWGGAPDGFFWLELRGSLFETIPGGFRKRMAELLNTRVEVISRPHAGLEAHVTVPDDEKPPPGEPKASPKSGSVGTRIEEW